MSTERQRLSYVVGLKISKWFELYARIRAFSYTAKFPTFDVPRSSCADRRCNALSEFSSRAGT